MPLPRKSTQGLHAQEDSGRLLQSAVINGNGSGNHKVDVLRFALNAGHDSPQATSRLTRAVADVA